jgi:hypothetical protein
MSNNQTVSRRTLLPVSLRVAVLFIAVAALVLKIYCAATTFGCDDVVLCFCFGKYIDAHGLIGVYQYAEFFNHTPLVGSFFRFIYQLSGPDHELFPFYLRLPGIIADFLAVLALIRFRERTGKPPWWALALFAASPVSFMVSGFHGNVDPILVLFLVLGACACAESRPLLCGLFFGLACNIKIVALLLSPVFFFYWLHRGKAVQFAGLTILMTLAGWSVPLLCVPVIFLKDVLGYSSIWGSWGITYWLEKTGTVEGQKASALFLHHSQVVIGLLKLVIISSTLWIAWRRRTVYGPQIFNSIAYVWIFFFVFAPGIAPQYMVWLAPFILVFSARWYLALTAATSVFLFMFYNTISRGMPWDRGMCDDRLTHLWIPWTNLPWAVLIACLFFLALTSSSRFRRPASGQSDGCYR